MTALRHMGVNVLAVVALLLVAAAAQAAPSKAEGPPSNSVAGKGSGEPAASAAPATGTKVPSDEAADKGEGETASAAGDSGSTPAPTTTPLSLRAPKPLSLRPKPASHGWWYQALAIGVVAVAGLWLYRRRRDTAKRPVHASLQVVARSRIGVRSELLIVDVGGRKWLLGVTPTSIRRLGRVDPSPCRSTEEEQDDAAPSSSRRKFGDALGQVERRLARYSQEGAQSVEASSQRAAGDAPPAAPRDTARPSAPRNTARPPQAKAESSQGGRQARGLLRLARKS